MAKRTAKPRFIVTGDKEIDRTLRKMELKMSRKLVRQALRKAMKPMHKLSVQFAPKASGDLANNIKLRAGKAKRRGVALEVRTEGEHSHIASFLEFGTKYIPAKPFMRRAYDQTKDEARRMLLKELWNNIRKLGM